MESAVNYRGLRHGVAVVVVLLGALAGLVAVAASGAFAQTAPPDDPPDLVYALTERNELISFNGNEPREILTRENITGLEDGEDLVGIDFRPTSQNTDPATQGGLYGVSDQSNVYLIDETTAVATQVSTLSVPLEGRVFGIDFNPTVDRLRIVSDADQSLRANVDTGATLVDGDLSYAEGDENQGENPNITGVAYRNNQPAAFNPPGTTANTTELYDIDFELNVLATQNPPNDGTLVTDGPLGVNVNSLIGFDIVTRGASPAGDAAFTSFKAKGSKNSVFYNVELDDPNAGESTRIDRIGGKNSRVEDIAIPIGQP